MPVDHKRFRKRLGAKYTVDAQPIGAISTGNPFLDHNIGIGGIPLSRLTVLTGVEASGKTTLALRLVGQVQQQGGIAIYHDLEYKLNPLYAIELGVDWDAMILSQPQSMEQTLASVKKAIEVARDSDLSPQRPCLIILDSINALVPKRTLEDKDFEKRMPGIRANLMSEILPSLQNLMALQPISLLFVSQVRTDINPFGSSKNLVGCGWAPKFYCSLIIELIRKEIIKRTVDEKTQEIGLTSIANIPKNQCGRPFLKCEVDFIWGHGIDYYKSLYQLAIKEGLIQQKGGWYAMAIGDDEVRWGTNQRNWHEKKKGQIVVKHLKEQLGIK